MTDNTHDVELVLKPNGFAETITVDGHDLKNHLRAVTLRAEAGRPPQLGLDIAVVGLTIARGEMDVRINDDLREALIALGWVPPEQARALLAGHTDTPERGAA